MIFTNKHKVVTTPVIVVDALGFSDKIHKADGERLITISKELDKQYYKFRSKVPFARALVGKNSVFGSNDFSTFRLNDMFIVYSDKNKKDYVLRYLVTASMIYHILLLENFIPRGGLGYGQVIRNPESFIGGGFIDAYAAAEKRSDLTRHICAIKISPEFFARIPDSERLYKLVCFYEGEFFIHPTALHDPDMEKFDHEMILRLLNESNANTEKMSATEKFLNEYEDFESALLPESKSKKWHMNS